MAKDYVCTNFQLNYSIFLDHREAGDLYKSSNFCVFVH